MKRLLAALLISATLALAGCNHDPGTGTIERKAYSAGYTWYSSQCVVYGKYGCVSSILVPYYVPPEWQFYLRKDDKHSGWHDVNQTEYSRYQIGQLYR